MVGKGFRSRDLTASNGTACTIYAKNSIHILRERVKYTAKGSLFLTCKLSSTKAYVTNRHLHNTVAALVLKFGKRSESAANVWRKGLSFVGIIQL